MSTTPLFHVVDAVTIPVSDLDAGLCFYHEPPARPDQGLTCRCRIRATRATNTSTSGVVAVMVTPSVALTASVLFPSISARQITTIIAACTSASGVAGVWAVVPRRQSPAAPIDRHGREAWRMPPLHMLPAPLLSGGRKLAWPRCAPTQPSR